MILIISISFTNQTELCNQLWKKCLSLYGPKLLVKKHYTLIISALICEYVLEKKYEQGKYSFIKIKLLNR